jgi:hypothetical protein
MTNVKVTVKGNKIKVYSEFTNTYYNGSIDSKGNIVAKKALDLKMIRKVKAAGMLEGLV